MSNDDTIVIPKEALLCSEPLPDDSLYVVNTAAFRFHGREKQKDCFIRRCEFNVSKHRTAKHESLPPTCADNHCKKLEIIKLSRPDVI